MAAFYLPYLHVPSVGGPHHYGASPPHGFPQAADVRETCITGILLHEEETINLRRPEYRYVFICAQQHAVSVRKAGCYRCSTSCTTSLTLESRVRESMEMNVDSTHRQRRARSSRRLSHHSFALERMDLQTHGEGTKSHPSWCALITMTASPQRRDASRNGSEWPDCEHGSVLMHRYNWTSGACRTSGLGSSNHADKGTRRNAHFSEYQTPQ